MRKQVLIRSIVGLLLIFVTGCHYVGIRGNGHITKKIFQIEQFEKLSISGIFSARVIVGNKTGLKLIAEKNLIKFIKIKNDGNTLKIYSTRNLSPRRKLLVIINTPALNSIEASGVTRIFVKGINTESFNVDCSGASVIKLIGKVVNFDADISGASYLNSKHLIAENVKIDCSGASKAIVNAKSSLSVEASGASSVSFTGNPKVVNTDVSGIAKVEKY